MDPRRERIYELAAAALGVPRDTLDPRAPLGRIDSLDIVELVMAVEQAFDIEIDDDAAESIQCLDDLVRAVERRLGGDDDNAAGVRMPQGPR